MTLRSIRTSGPWILLAALLASGCSSWKVVRQYDRWTLYESPRSAVAVDQFQAAFEPAFDTIEGILGPFENRIRVHAWHGAVRMEGSDRSMIGVEGDDGIEEIPGIGPARIQAYHARSGGRPFSPSGVFIGVPDTGTAAHELVHARLAELDARLPLWFEEGFASLCGDGILTDGAWVIDGLACWPLRELANQRLGDAELARLLAIEATDDSSVKDNVLVHFVGWAVVFDLYRETGVMDWTVWYELFDTDDTLGDARRRLDRTLSEGTPHSWLVRLEDPRPEVRLAAAKGTWKLRSREVLEELLAALDTETDPQVRVGLAVNALASAGELELPWRTWRRVERGVRVALRDPELPDPDERRAALELYRAYREGGGRASAQDALRQLSRFWEE